jgi:pimeloyl-ACP methyl ester carboxylesterase
MFGHMLDATRVFLSTLRGRPSGPSAPASAVEHLRNYAELGEPCNFKLSYLASAAPETTRVIFIHGTPGAATGWADYLLSPPPGVQVIAVDRAGFGRSGPMNAVEKLELQSAAIAALFPYDASSVVVVGHSLGGAIAARLAADYPRRVAALVLVAASIDPTLERIHMAQRIAAKSCIRWALPRAIRNANAELLSLKGELETLAPILSKIEAPTFILHGADDPLVPAANVEFMRRRISRAASMHIKILDNKNHFLPWNSAGALREIIDLALVAARARR